MPCGKSDFAARSDEDIFAVARKRRQMLVTDDRDFWDDRQFPLRSCAGILRLPDIVMI